MYDRFIKQKRSDFMSKVLFLSIPSHGHVNPTIGLVSELVKQGEEVIYFSSVEFKEKIEKAGATFKSYCEDLNIFHAKNEDDSEAGGGFFGTMNRLLKSSDKIIDDILLQTKGIQFDYMIHSVVFPFAGVMKQILKIPTVSSLAIYVGLQAFLDENEEETADLPPQFQAIMKAYQEESKRINEKYSVKMPDKIMDLLFNKGDINFVYTSRYFIPKADCDFFDDSYKFVGPPVYDRKEKLDFPFEKLEGKKVIYISLGTVFSTYNLELYNIFFKSFADLDAVIVMAAYNVDLSQFDIPANFIVRNYVPQSEILKHTDAAITHAGMNSISDLLYNNVPFVALPLGADQPVLAKRAEELGAAISLDSATITPEILRNAVEKVLSVPSYLENIKKISDSFNEAGGYKKAVDEIFKLKKEKEICN
jgi:MGT family glycosyltransferase